MTFCGSASQATPQAQRSIHHRKSFCLCTDRFVWNRDQRTLRHSCHATGTGGEVGSKFELATYKVAMKTHCRRRHRSWARSRSPARRAAHSRLEAQALPSTFVHIALPQAGPCSQRDAGRSRSRPTVKVTPLRGPGHAGPWPRPRGSPTGPRGAFNSVERTGTDT